MGRKIKDCVDYFPHYAHDGKTLFILESKYGNDGYALWFKLLELLCRADGHFLDCRDETEWQYLCGKARLNEKTVTEILDLLSRLGQLDRELWKNRVIWVQGLVDNLKTVYDKRKRALPSKPEIAHEIKDYTSDLADKGNQRVFSAQLVQEIPQLVPETRQSRVEKSKDLTTTTTTAREDVPEPSDEQSYDPAIPEPLQPIVFEPSPNDLPEEMSDLDFAELQRVYETRIQDGRRLDATTRQKLLELCDLLPLSVVVEVVDEAKEYAKGGQSCFKHVKEIALAWRDEGIDTHEKALLKRRSKNRASPPKKGVVSNATLKGFEVFWEAFPKKREKPDAEQAWAVCAPDDALTQRIMAALEIAKGSPEWQNAGGRYIPYPAKWLEQRRWEDEYTPEQLAKVQKGNLSTLHYSNERQYQTGELDALIEDLRGDTDNGGDERAKMQ